MVNVAICGGGELGNDCLEVYKDRLLYQLKMKDIDYIRAYNGYTEIYVGKTNFRREDSLIAIWNKLDERLFLKISRQHIVNMLKITKLHRGEVYIGSEKFIISTRLKKTVERKYVEFVIGHRSQS